jgi:hypothetical protein
LSEAAFHGGLIVAVYAAGPLRAEPVHLGLPSRAPPFAGATSSEERYSDDVRLRRVTGFVSGRPGWAKELATWRCMTSADCLSAVCDTVSQEPNGSLCDGSGPLRALIVDVFGV